MAKRSALKDQPAPHDNVMDEAPKKFQRLMRFKQAPKAVHRQQPEHPWKIQPGESYSQFEARLQQQQKDKKAPKIKKESAPFDANLEALKMEPLDKPPRKQLKRRERRLKLKELKASKQSSDDDEVHRERIPFGEQALAPPTLKPIKATLKMPKSLTHAGRTPLL